MKTVLYLNHSMAIGGIETMIVDFARMTREAGYFPEVAVMRGGGSLEAQLSKMSIPVHDLAKREGIDPALPWRLARLMRSRRVHILHTNNYSAWLYGVAARMLAPACHVHSEHSRELGPRRRMTEAALSHFTDQIVAVSSDVEAYLHGITAIRHDRIQTVPNGVNTHRFRPDHARRCAQREALQIADGLLVLGIIARLVPLKNHAMLLRAFSMLEQSIQARARLLVVGDGKERQALTRLAEELNIADRVLFTGARHDTESMLNAMDVYALSSNSEGMNLTLLEAMSSSLPVVATSVGGNVELVLDGVTGFLVPVNDSERMAAALTMLLSDDSMRARFSVAARERVISHFDESATMERYIHLYENRSADRH